LCFSRIDPELCFVLAVYSPLKKGFRDLKVGVNEKKSHPIFFALKFLLNYIITPLALQHIHGIFTSPVSIGKIHLPSGSIFQPAMMGWPWAGRTRKGAEPQKNLPPNKVRPKKAHDSPHADSKLKETFLVEATLKGCRTSLLNLDAFALVSNEISNSLQTPWSDPCSGINYMSRSKLNTFSQAEPDSVVTGLGRVSLSSYKVL